MIAGRAAVTQPRWPSASTILPSRWTYAPTSSLPNGEVPTSRVPPNCAMLGPSACDRAGRLKYPTRNSTTSPRGYLELPIGVHSRGGATTTDDERTPARI